MSNWSHIPGSTIGYSNFPDSESNQGEITGALSMWFKELLGDVEINIVPPFIGTYDCLVLRIPIEESFCDIQLTLFDHHCQIGFQSIHYNDPKFFEELEDEILGRIKHFEESSHVAKMWRRCGCP